jgi:Uma2 family endonuclease
MATAEALLTAEEYAQMPDDGTPNELVRGRIVPMTVPTPLHGMICTTIAHILYTYAEEHGLGRVASNDSGVITERDPDTVRGPDVSFYSYTRLPKGPVPPGYLSVVPDIVFEVRSPSDRWRDIHAKAFEYLDAGVQLVCVVEPAQKTVHVYSAEQPIRTVTAEEELSIPEVLGNFRIKVQRFFE